MVADSKDSKHFWLKNAHIPVCLLSSEHPEIVAQQTREGLSLVDIEIQSGVICRIVPAGTEAHNHPLVWELKGGQVWPCFVDLHTHLDKGHIWDRTPNLDGTFDCAIAASQTDAEKYWDEKDIYRRMEFGLQCSYAHGTQAIRTHIDSAGPHGEISWRVFKTLQAEWSGRLTLQAASLVPLEYFSTPEGEKLADQVAEVGGLLGGLVLMQPEMDTHLDRVFTLAKDRRLNLDFHTDESTDPTDITLRHVAAAAIRHQFSGQIVCGHCCSLSVQSPDEVAQTLQLVKQANIGVVSLPLCNLYLQDRQTNRTPRLRGVTLLHELKQAEIPVAIASDNCRDPFHPYGDHDGLEVFKLSARIAHLDRPYGDWPQTITKTPAELMGLPAMGWIGVGLPANLVLFKGRTYGELLSRSQHDRVVLRNGKSIDTTLPDYADLDDLYGFTEVAS